MILQQQKQQDPSMSYSDQHIISCHKKKKIRREKENIDDEGEGWRR